MISYRNGGSYVSIDRRGTKRRIVFAEDIPPQRPETFDLKVTDYCDAACPFCHEKSTKSGKHADLRALLIAIEPLSYGTEIAIGGGNPLDWPHLDEFLQEMKIRKNICNITVNSLHIRSAIKRILALQEKSLIWGVGVSGKKHGNISLDSLDLPSDHGIKNMCYHAIAHVNLLESAEKASRDLHHVLVLGYKDWGRGSRYKHSLTETKTSTLQEQIKNLRDQGYKVSFDNLALEQCDVRKIVSEQEWNSQYMGEDGRWSMFIDGVKQEYAKSSTSGNRQKFTDISVIDFFKSMQK